MCIHVGVVTTQQELRQDSLASLGFALATGTLSLSLVGLGTKALPAGAFAMQGIACTLGRLTMSLCRFWQGKEVEANFIRLQGLEQLDIEVKGVVREPLELSPHPDQVQEHLSIRFEDLLQRGS